jgi:hypothetical protein
MINFAEWLKAQATRDDPIGDLARDAVQDPCWPQDGDLQAFEEYLTYGVGACYEAYTALRAAWAEYHRAGFETGAMPDPLILEDLDDTIEQVNLATEQLDEHGFCLIRSRVTGGTWATCRTEADRFKVPKGILVYSFDEFRELLAAVGCGKVTTMAAWLSKRRPGRT